MQRKQIGCWIAVMVLLVWVSITLAGPVPEEARRFMARGIAAVEMAKSASDYGLAAKEFEQAAGLAPDWPDAYYNLGSVQSKAGDIASAIKSFQRFLVLTPESPDAAKVRDEIFKLEYRQERIKKVVELAGVWLFKNTAYTISVNGSEFNAKSMEEITSSADGVKVISDGGVLAGKMERIPRGKSEVVFKGRMDGPIIKGIRYRSPFTEQLSKCTIPGDQSEFTGTISEDSNHITVNFQKSMYQADRDAGVFFGLDSCTGVTKTGEMPEKIVLTRKNRIQGKVDPAGPASKTPKKVVGIVGLRISEVDPPLITDVLLGMPAAEAGIKTGDRILRVDRKDAKSLTSHQLLEMIRGQAGSSVAIEVERKDEIKPLSFTLVRKVQTPDEENVRNSRFIAHENGTVLDTKTNLMWAAKDNGAGINWQDAKNYCKNYRGGGYTDWRMPTQNELAGLYDVNKSRPVACDGNYNIHVATELIDITCFSPWTDETRGFFSTEASLFSFVNGNRIWTVQSLDTYIVRALPVRSGK